MILKAFAKINLFLCVTGRRPDGYHTLFTLMCPVGLHDTIELLFSGSGVRVTCAHPDVPEDASNLAAAAAIRFLEKCGRSDGVRITIDKQIPVGAGLGGGSSDAGTVLAGFNRRFGGPLSRPELTDIALSLGADVPFFIDPRPAIATGVGEVLNPLPDVPSRPVLIVFPGVFVRTADIFKRCNLGLTKCEKQLKKFNFEKDLNKIDALLCNDLEPITEKLHPDIRRAKSALLTHGADGALMTGSGSAVFGLFETTVKAAEAREAIAPRYPRWRFFLTTLTGSASTGPDAPDRFE